VLPCHAVAFKPSLLYVNAFPCLYESDSALKGFQGRTTRARFARYLPSSIMTIRAVKYVLLEQKPFVMESMSRLMKMDG